jgi:hypothetical protein
MNPYVDNADVEVRAERSAIFLGKIKMRPILQGGPPPGTPLYGTNLLLSKAKDKPIIAKKFTKK